MRSSLTVPAVPVVEIAQVPVAFVPSVHATSLKVANAVADPYACCQMRSPRASFRRVSMLSLPPEASAYVLNTIPSAHGDVLLLFHDVNNGLAYDAVKLLGAAVLLSTLDTRGTVMLAEPLNDSPFMLRAVVKVAALVAVLAFPVNGPANPAAVSVVPSNVRFALPAAAFEPFL
jgi:hypothetical protein